MFHHSKLLVACILATSMNQLAYIDFVHGINFNSARSLAVAIRPNGTAGIFTPNGELLVALNGHSGPVTSIRFSETDTFVITTSTDKTAKIWAITGELLATLGNHSGTVKSAHFLNKDMHVQTLCEDGSTKIWDLCAAGAHKAAGYYEDLY